MFRDVSGFAEYAVLVKVIHQKSSKLSSKKRYSKKFLITYSVNLGFCQLIINN